MGVAQAGQASSGSTRARRRVEVLPLLFVLMRVIRTLPARARSPIAVSARGSQRATGSRGILHMVNYAYEYARRNGAGRAPPLVGRGAAALRRHAGGRGRGEMPNQERRTVSPHFDARPSSGTLARGAQRG